MICFPGQKHFRMNAGNHAAEKRRYFTAWRMI